MPENSYAGIPVFAHLEIHERVAGLLGDLAAGSAVLDAPAGPGAMSRRLKDLGFQVTAADLHPEEFRPTDIPCARADLNHALPFADESFDAAVCIEGIEHLQAPFTLARELWRVLRPGGRLVVTTPNITSANSRLRFLLTGFFSLAERPVNECERETLNDHIHPLTYPQLRYILRSSGFEVRRVIGCVRQGGRWFGLVAPAGRWYLRKALRKERSLAQREVNGQIARELFSAELLRARDLIVVAEKA